MNDILTLEKKYYPKQDVIDRLVLENFIYQNADITIKPGSSLTSIMNKLSRNGINSLKDLFEADTESLARLHGVGTKVLEILLGAKQRMLEELQQEP